MHWHESAKRQAQSNQRQNCNKIYSPNAVTDKNQSNHFHFVLHQAQSNVTTLTRVKKKLYISGVDSIFYLRY